MDAEFIPIFELFTTTDHIKIYANGIVEGCPNLIGVVNFIPFVASSDDVLRRFDKPWESVNEIGPTRAHMKESL